ncbi:SurA N-terminal domain-containing protein [Streptomyces sannanensis]|uniref:SurA N-terminal domain-containing protein n=1 Tax=Streptomyces sannanensis TaxID=285536 RepID=UPI0031E773A8
MHRRRRTALSVSAAIVAATPLLAACGNAAHPGAAAVVGGDRIEVSSLQAQVKEVRAAQGRQPQAAQLIGNTGQLSRIKLRDMITVLVVERAAADVGVTVSRKEVQEEYRAAVAQSGGEQAFAARLLQGNALAPGQIEQAVRTQILVTKLAAALGTELGSPQAEQKIGTALSAASKELHISVNPRYGSWDDVNVRLGDYRTPWVTQVSQAAGPGGARVSG